MLKRMLLAVLVIGIVLAVGAIAITAQSPRDGGGTGRFVLATQATQLDGHVLWVMDSHTGALRAYSVMLGPNKAIVYGEIPRSPGARE